jgi:hypothetical protein
MKLPLHFNMFLKFPVCSQMLPIAPHFIPYLYPKFYSSNLYKQAWGGDYKSVQKAFIIYFSGPPRMPITKEKKKKEKNLGGSDD